MSGKILAVCGYCGSEFVTYKAWIKRGSGKYCSRECGYKWRSENNRGVSASNWRGGGEIVSCLNCGIQFIATKAEVKQGGGKTCSPKCRKEWRSKNSKGDKNPNWRGGKVTKPCLFCGEQLELDPSEKDKRWFCSQGCMGKWYSEKKSGENSHCWRGGVSFSPYAPEFNYKIKELIRERDGRKCQLCGAEEKSAARKLSVHHVDYNKNNSNPENLISLCHDCHSRTNFNREDWFLFFIQKKHTTRSNNFKEVLGHDLNQDNRNVSASICS